MNKPILHRQLVNSVALGRREFMNLGISALGATLCAYGGLLFTPCIGLRSTETDPQPESPDYMERLDYPAYLLSNMSDGDIRLFMPEVLFSSLIVFIWFMNKPELTEKIQRNLPSLIAATFPNIVESLFEGSRPENASIIQLEMAWDAGFEIMLTLFFMEEERQISPLDPEGMYSKITGR